MEIRADAAGAALPDSADERAGLDRYGDGQFTDSAEKQHDGKQGDCDPAKRGPGGSPGNQGQLV